MKIGIIGFGFVGKAIGWTHRNDELIIRDPKLQDSAELAQFIGCEAIFICVPSPSTQDGHCNTSMLEQTVKELLLIVGDNEIPIICKTTAPPTFYQRLQQEYSNIVHCPEFLTAANANDDYLNQNYCVLGGDYDVCVKARQIIIHGRPMATDKFTIVPIKTAALYKYMINCYLATKVTFMNEFKKVADGLDVDWRDLLYLSDHEDRIGATHMNVPGPDGKYGWGGSCFPKDVTAIQMEAIDLKINFELMNSVSAINKKHRE